MTNLVVDTSGETALIAAAQLIESAAFNLARKLSAEDTAELVAISLRLSEFADGLPDGLTQLLQQQTRVH